MFVVTLCCAIPNAIVIILVVKNPEVSTRIPLDDYVLIDLRKYALI